MFRDFLSFLVVAGLSVYQVTVVTLLAFMESLVEQEFSVSNIVNYMAGIRSYFIIYGLNTSPFRDERLHLFQKSLKYTRKFVPKTTTIILISCCVSYLFLKHCHSPRFIELCTSFPFSPSYAFPTFCPIPLNDVTRQLCRGDLIFPKIPLLSLSNGRKLFKTEETLLLFCLISRFPLCPYQAFKLMVLEIPGSPNYPLFRIPRKGVLVSLTD